ncbi:protein DEHYDRATION-INDUCED 19 homolog 4-like isoform X2 [Oryza brachyantha]|uniref:protein DEHYDRATION-INDUCED 19 homolog 4-like isoform X2 n=1 Tax=Oryza brachyantha TaxID=4533 RepID=UPI0007766784|nr:protein DEHYDRATION-INDUCED 19 homolog 4-like isoform X2 [Oryza brachyantha]
MDMDAWERLAADVRLHDALIGLEDAEGSGDEEERGAAEVACPFCDEEFDGFGLCCHIEDEHQAENRAGVCPICYDGVGMDLVSHITSQHPSFFKGKWRNRRVSHGSHSSSRAALKKDAKYLQYRYGGSTRSASQNTEADPLLSSFVSNFTDIDLPKDVQQEFSDEMDEKSVSLEQKEQKPVESADDEPLLPEVKEEKTRRSQFVQGLVLSLMFDDIL